MRIEHIALWTCRLEDLKAFYETYFAARTGDRYTNPRTGFQSYFCSFGAGARLELMQAPDVDPQRGPRRGTGYAHLSLSVGSREEVDRLTTRIAADGYQVWSPPRTTGDGYYESVVLDPDGNQVEITV